LTPDIDVRGGTSSRRERKKWYDAPLLDRGALDLELRLEVWRADLERQAVISGLLGVMFVDQYGSKLDLIPELEIWATDN
jgi:hypothetical protein